MKALNKLRVTWSKRENDVLVSWPVGLGTKSDAHWLSAKFGRDFTGELIRRGYDMTTMRFSVEPLPGNCKFQSQREDAGGERGRK